MNNSIENLFGNITEKIEGIPGAVHDIGNGAQKTIDSINSNPLPNIALAPTLSAVLNSSWQRNNICNMEGFEWTEFQSGDGCTLKGWTYRAPGQSNSRGTCFMMHGFCDNSTSLVEGAKNISQKYNLTVIGFDHRYHGWSDKTPHYPTFGRCEAYDVEAAMDYADRNNYPKPYILHGISLGAMAAQRAAIEDRRVAGAFLLSVPATPWHAIEAKLHFIHPVADLINEAYGWDVLGTGSLYAHQQDTDHRPLICYVMGDNDSYGIGKTKEIFHYWHNGEPGCENTLPSENRQCRKFFQTVYGAIHPDKPGYCVWDWEGYGPLENNFFETVLS